ncbi:SDR family oxidoreductase [Actinospica sp. MGRD01-02]|uniref:SDR family oxidoreductase n=1 Tax=Actinospica acidithermotolerans TaxID=2828514 RepID=A0A941ECN2_9ACTN|nr:SDR family oxidoreductase [Actinospica acidithermotolerans]MBR7829081.1 SDR family oxidoreductase [Actinospica acidithermotolerans]
MRVFVTGATGFIGSAVVRDLLDAGHQVVGLARSDEGAASLAATGAEVRRGTLHDLDVLRSEADAADGVIHTAFIHDFADFDASCETDRLVIEAFGETMAGSDKPLVVAAGTALIRDHVLLTEDVPAPIPPLYPRVSEQTAIIFAKRGVRASAIRIAPSAHGEGDKGFVPLLIGLAREKGYAAYPGEGKNVWPAVHRLDVARLFRLALESAPAGSTLHAAAEQGVEFRRIAEAIGAGLDVPVRSVAGAEIPAYFGGFTGFAQIDNPTSSTLTRERYGWDPQQPGLIEDIERAGYFTQK